MRRFYRFVYLAALVPAYAQKYEFGLHGGFSHYSKQSVENGSASADAGFNGGLGVGIALGHNMYEHLGGEIRYTYLRNDLKLSSGGQSVSFGSEAHAVHYDFLLHTTGAEARVRPYFAFGGGVKYFRGTGEEQAFQPLSKFAILTRTSDVKPLVSFGGGLKFAVSRHILFRV